MRYWMKSAEKLALDPFVEPLSVGIAHICERQSRFAVIRHPDDLSLATQLLLIPCKSELELNHLANHQRSDAFQSDTCLADVDGLSLEPSLAEINDASVCA